MSSLINFGLWVLNLIILRLVNVELKHSWAHECRSTESSTHRCRACVYVCMCVCMCACVCSFDAEDDGQHGQHRNGTKSMAIRTQNYAFQPR